MILPKGCPIITWSPLSLQYPFHANFWVLKELSSSTWDNRKDSNIWVGSNLIFNWNLLNLFSYVKKKNRSYCCWVWSLLSPIHLFSFRTTFCWSYNSASDLWDLESNTKAISYFLYSSTGKAGRKFLLQNFLNKNLSSILLSSLKFSFLFVLFFPSFIFSCAKHLLLLAYILRLLLILLFASLSHLLHFLITLLPQYFVQVLRNRLILEAFQFHLHLISHLFFSNFLLTPLKIHYFSPHFCY